MAHRVKASHLHAELERLAGAGLVTVGRLGNQKHYQANRSAPIFEELRGIVLKTFGLAEVLRAALASVADRLRVAFIYGSLAKGTDTVKSDVDVLLVGDDLEYADVFGAVQEAERRLGRKVNPHIYSSSEFAEKSREQGGFLSRVLDGPKVFLFGSDDDFTKPRAARRQRRSQG